MDFYGHTLPEPPQNEWLKDEILDGLFSGASY